MWTAIIGVIGTLLGVAIGGGVNFLVNQAKFKREKDWEKKQLIREKLEAICQIVEEIDDWHRKLYAEALGLLTIGKKLEIGNKKLPIDRLSMLINFYAPAIKPFLESINEYSILFGEAIVIIISIDESEDRKKQAIIDITLAQASIRKICEAMTSASADLARKYI